MRWLALVLVVACQRPVVEPAPITPVTVAKPTPDAAPLPSGPIRARIIGVEVESSAGLIVKLAAGSDQGVTTEWTACLLRASSDTCHPAKLEIVRVAPRWTETRLTATDVVSGNMSAKLVPPP